MRIPAQLLFLGSLLVPITHALHESEVGLVDWHKAQIGVPLTHHHGLAPIFHRVDVGRNGSKSVILSATQSNVLAAVDVIDGSVAWRQVFEKHDPILVFKKHKQVVASLSGPGGSTLRLFSALHGHLLLEKKIHSLSQGKKFEPDYLGASLAFLNDEGGDMMVLTNGCVVQRIARNGDIKWSWTSEDQASLIINTHILPGPEVTYIIGYAKSIKSYTLHATSLNSKTGAQFASQNIPSTLSSSLSPFIALAPRTEIEDGKDVVVDGRVIWLEGTQGQMRSFPLDSDLTGKVGAFKGVQYNSIVSVCLDTEGYFMTIKEDGSGTLVRSNAKREGIGAVWEWSDSKTQQHYTPSTYSSGFDKDGNPYISRVFWSHAYRKVSVHTLAPHLGNGGLVTGITLPFDTGSHGIVIHAAIDAANPSPMSVLTRLVLTTSTGSVQFWASGQPKPQWNRDEGLADIAVVELVEVPERVETGGEVSEEGFWKRVGRQLVEGRDFPDYAVRFIKRFVTGSYASVSSPVQRIFNSNFTSDKNNTTTFSRDLFGFRQIIVAATHHGKIYGIDSGSGEVVWSRVFGLGWARDVGAKVVPIRIYVLKTVGDDIEGARMKGPEVVVVAQRLADNSLVDTVLFHFDAITGQDVMKTSPIGEPFEGFDIIPGPIVECFLFQNQTKTILLLDEFMQVYLYPDTLENKADFLASVSSLYFPVRAGGPGKRQLIGHQFIHNPGLSHRHIGSPSWTFAFSDHEDIISVVPSIKGPIASAGKVLGNRSTLYKYLNPHLTAVTTATSRESVTCGLYLVDTVKGTLIYHTSITPSVGVCDVKVTLTENWLVYSYYDDAHKSQMVVSVELYEGLGVDDKTRSESLSSFSNKTTHVSIYERGFILPYGLLTLTSTSTKFGITSKDIVFASTNNKIQSLSRRFLDPRRPNRKVTTDEAEEQLIQYEPVLPSHPTRVLSHNYQVANIKRIVTAPALLESTSLIFAYGLDLFLTRTAPSGTFDVLSENFNKVQLVLTIGALAVAIIITKPMVQRKRLRERWY